MARTCCWVLEKHQPPSFGGSGSILPGVEVSFRTKIMHPAFLPQRCSKSHPKTRRVYCPDVPLVDWMICKALRLGSRQRHEDFLFGETRLDQIVPNHISGHCVCVFGQARTLIQYGEAVPKSMRAWFAVYLLPSGVAAMARTKRLFQTE